MKNSLNIVFTAILFLTIFGMFYIKDQVKYLRKDLKEISRQIVDSKKQIHILEAEWQYLNNPERIRKLSEQYLKLEPISVSQYYNPLTIEPVNIATYQASHSRRIKLINPTLKPMLTAY